MEEFLYKVSVIIPAYNVEHYLRSCIDSLLKQNIDKNEMEIILINDGSTDESLEICYEYSHKYLKILAFTKDNEGPSATRNLGIKMRMVNILT